MNTTTALAFASNMSDKLKSQTIKRIERYLKNPSFDKWEDIHCIIIDGEEKMRTIWNAVIEIDPHFPRYGRRTGRIKKRISGPFTSWTLQCRGVATKLAWRMQDALATLRKIWNVPKNYDLKPHLAKSVSQFDCKVLPFNQKAKYDAVEMHPCREIQPGVFEQCDEEEADLWSVYLHDTNGGLVCVADCATSNAAEELFSLLNYFLPLFI